MLLLPRRSWASDASYIWSAEALRGALGLGAVAWRAGGALDLRAACLELGLELAQPLLALPGELLDLHQLLLDVVQVGAEIALQLAHGLLGCW